MQTPKFSPQISIGNILQILMFVVTATAGYILIDQRSQGNSENLIEIQEDVEEIEIRMRRVEQEQVRSDERYSSILTILGRMDSRLERIEANQ